MSCALAVVVGAALPAEPGLALLVRQDGLIAVVSLRSRHSRPGPRLIQCRGRFGPGLARLLRIPQSRARGEHGAPVLRHAFVDPQQRVLHRHVVVRGGQVRGPAELAVPGMHVLVREQVASRSGAIPFGEEIRIVAVLAGAMVLEADVAEVIAEREQEIVVIVMMRAEQRIGLARELRVGGQGRRRMIAALGRIGHDVELHRGLSVASSGTRLKCIPGEQRRIEQRLERHGLEAHALRRHAIATSSADAKLPARRQRDGGLDVDLARGVAGRIEHHGVPLQPQQLGRASTMRPWLSSCGSQELKFAVRARVAPSGTSRWNA